MPLGFSWIYRQEYRTLAEELRTLKAITLDDITQLLQEYPLDNITIMGLGPKELQL